MDEPTAICLTGWGEASLDGLETQKLLASVYARAGCEMGYDGSASLSLSEMPRQEEQIVLQGHHPAERVPQGPEME